MSRRRDVLASVLAVAACATGGAPEDCVEAYRGAVARDDAAAAYALLSEPVRRRVSRAEFEARWKDTKAERAEQARDLASPRVAALEARVAAGDARLVLREEGQGWWVAGAALPGESAATPEAALRALVRAVERRDYAAFARLLTRARREKVEKELRDRIDNLKAAVGRPVEVESDRVVVQYGPEFRIWLRREGDEWRVEDVE